MKNRILLLNILLLGLIPLYASTPVGEWTNHASYRNTTSLEETENKIFAIANNHLYSITKDGEYIDTYSKLDGFCSPNVQCIAYDKSIGKLVIAYSNSNIDVIDSDGNIHNIPDLYRKELSSDKTIHKIFFYNKNAYLATGLGIVVLNLSKYEIKDTYIIGDNAQMVPIYDIQIYDGYIYALLENKIKAALIEKTNLLDYKNWVDDKLTVPYTGKSFSHLTVFNGCFILAENQGNVYRYNYNESKNWETLFENTASNPVKVRTHNGNLLISALTEFFRYDSSWQLEHISNFYNLDLLYTNGIYWTASGESGTMKFKFNEYNISHIPDGPYTGKAQKIIFDGEKFVVAPGFSWLNRGLSYDGVLWKGAVMLLKNGRWTSYTAANSGAAAISPDGYFYDVVSVAVDPKNKNHIFATTWGEGVYEFLDGKAIKLHNKESSNGVLKDVGGYGPHYVRVDGLTYNKDGNLYLVNTLEAPIGSVNAVAYMTTDGIWHEATGYSPVESYEHLNKLLFHSNGQSWIVSTRSPGCVYIKKDNKSKSFSTFTDKDGRSVTPSYIYDIAEDKEGNMWVGTSSGPITFTNCSKVFDSDYRCTRVKVPRNDGTGLADYLLDGIGVKTIAIDGANRKWLGTDNSGVFLLSADGLTTIHHFTTDNSPLPSNEVTAIAIDSNTGEVLIGTTEGLVCYGGNATKPVKDMKKSDIYVYPNPVTPDYTGMITIVGLEDNSTVKIVDASGHLVFEGISNGGSFAWNGKNFSGQNVSGGVYFYHLFNSDEDDSRSAVAKVLIIR